MLNPRGLSLTEVQMRIQFDQTSSWRCLIHGALLSAAILGCRLSIGAERPLPPEVRVGEATYSISEAERVAVSDETLARYVRLRAQTASGLAGHIKLAQWCDRNGLPEQAKAHWMQVLKVSPRDKNALKALDLRWYRGTLMANSEAEELVAFEEETRRKLKRYERQFSVWRRTVVQGDDAERDRVVDELRRIDPQVAIVAIDKVLLTPTDDEVQTATLQQIGIQMLGEFVNSQSVLAWFAVNSPIPEVRDAALEELKKKPLAETVPVLLARMQMPLEVTVSARQEKKGVATDYSFYREGPGQSEFQRSFTAYRRLQGPALVPISVPVGRQRSSSAQPRTFLIPSL